MTLGARVVAVSVLSVRFTRFSTTCCQKPTTLR